MKITSLGFRWGRFYLTPHTVPFYVSMKGKVIPHHDNNNNDSIKIDPDIKKSIQKIFDIENK